MSPELHRPSPSGPRPEANLRRVQVWLVSESLHQLTGAGKPCGALPDAVDSLCTQSPNREALPWCVPQEGSHLGVLFVSKATGWVDRRPFCELTLPSWFTL